MKPILTFFLCAIAAFGQAILMPLPKQQFFDNNGHPLAGGKVYSYAAGTSSPLSTYTDSTASVANANPVILDASGRANIWLGPANYKIELRDASDVSVWTVDRVSQSSNNNGFIVTGNTSINGGSVPASTPGLQVWYDPAGGASTFYGAGPAGGQTDINFTGRDVTFQGTSDTLGTDVILQASGNTGRIFLYGVNGIQLASRIYPSATTQTLAAGDSTHAFSEVWTAAIKTDSGALNINGAAATNGNIVVSPGAVAGNASFAVNMARTDQPGMYIVNKTGTTTANAFEIRDSVNTVKFKIIGSGDAGAPNAMVSASHYGLSGDTYDLGASTNRWRKLWVDDIDSSGTATVNNLTVTGTCTGCGGGGGGSSAFSGITTGTNTAATMTLGTGSTLTSSGTATVNFATAGATTPQRKDTAANISASSCAVGEMAFATDGTAGRNLYYCTATNSWTQQVAGTGGAAFSALTGGTNSGGAAMLVGASSSLKPTSTGVIWGTALVDGNQAAAVSIGTTASAVNGVTVTDAATGGKPAIAATGSDSNITLSLLGKGTGRVELGGMNAYVDGSGNLTVVSCTGCGGGGGAFLPLAGGTMSGSILTSAGSIGSTSNPWVDGIFSGTVYGANLKMILGTPGAPSDFYTWSMGAAHLLDLRDSSGTLEMRVDSLVHSLAFNGAVIPVGTTNVYDLGGTSSYWRTLYLGTSLIQNGVTRLDGSGNAVVQNLTVSGTCTGCGTGGGGGAYVPLAGGTMTGGLLANGTIDIGSGVSPWNNGIFAATVEAQRVRMIKGATSAPADFFDWYPDQSVNHVIRLLNSSAQALLTVDDTRASSSPTLFQFAGHVQPTAGNSYDLGTSGTTWRTGYFGTAVVVNGTTMLNASGQHVGAAVNVTGAIQSQATGASIAFQNSNSNFSVDGNGNISSAGSINVTGTNPYRVNGTTIVDASRNATFASVTTNAGGVVQSGATGTNASFQNTNFNFIVDGNGNISGAGQVNLTGGSSAYKMGGSTVIDAAHNFYAANASVGGKVIQYNGANTAGNGVGAILFHSTWQLYTGNVGTTSVLVGGAIPPAGLYRVYLNGACVSGCTGGAGTNNISFCWNDGVSVGTCIAMSVFQGTFPSDYSRNVRLDGSHTPIWSAVVGGGTSYYAAWGLEYLGN